MKKKTIPAVTAALLAASLTLGAAPAHASHYGWSWFPDTRSLVCQAFRAIC